MATMNARMTVGSIFASVGTAANAVTSVLDATTKGIGMLDTYVSGLVDEQEARAAANKEDFEVRIAEEKAQEMSERALSVLEFCSKSSKHAELYTKNFDAVLAAIKNRKAA